jgi:hypothetical protein
MVRFVLRSIVLFRLFCFFVLFVCYDFVVDYVIIYKVKQSHLFVLTALKSIVL